MRMIESNDYDVIEHHGGGGGGSPLTQPSTKYCLHLTEQCWLGIAEGTYGGYTIFITPQY